MITNIKQLYAKIDRKTDFIAMVAEDVDRNPQYIRSHWFSSFWTIPEEHQPRVVELLQKTIANQIEVKDPKELK